MIIRHLFYGCLLLLTTSLWSQRLVKQGHKQFQELAYSDAIVSFEKAIDKGYNSPRIYAELGDSYYFNANYKAATKWYQMLFLKPKNVLPIHYIRYAQSLKSSGNNALAEQILKQIPTNQPKINTNSVSSESKFIKKDTSRISERFKTQRVLFNSKYSDFSPSYFGEYIVFSSSRDTSGFFKRNHTWTNQPFTQLYKANPNVAGESPKRFSNNINTKFNQSSTIFTKDGTTVYFTRNSFENNKQGLNQKQTSVLKIYKAIKSGSDWEVIGALPFCNADYNVAHPALSPDEKTLYFASDMPGGFGASDLYKVAILPNGVYGTPENLGASINTLNRETFPFVSARNELFFASDGHKGFGGLDVFVANYANNTDFLAPQNVGEPINSRMDDFGFIINSDTRTGFFTSNRADGAGADDIYSFQELIPLPCKISIEGILQSDNNSAVLSNSEVILLDENQIQRDKTTSDQEGKYHFLVDCNRKYEILIQKKGFVATKTSFETTHLQHTLIQNIVLQKEIPVFKIGDDIGKKISILPIYFDVGKSNIRKQAAQELTKIKSVLEEYPTMILEIRSHTDSRDTAENNQILSTKRAESTVNWFIENGINPNRISSKGFGESQLLNQCNDGINCSESEHQLNRRSEFIVTRI